MNGVNIDLLDNDNVVLDDTVKDNYFRNLYIDIKRGFDILIALFVCILLLPISFIIKIAFVISGDNNSIFFKQARIGIDGKIINIYKYRSMFVNAEKMLEEYMENDIEIRNQYLLNKKLDNDPRVTKIGKFLRAYSIDELPQFINVLKGEMSVIGPRPYLPKEREDMGAYYNYIIKVKPGITGLWQISGRSNVSFQNRVKLDKYYYEFENFKLDIKIFLLTFVKVIKKDGAK